MGEQTLVTLSLVVLCCAFLMEEIIENSISSRFAEYISLPHTLM